jgi:hypothetical protein
MPGSEDVTTTGVQVEITIQPHLALDENRYRRAPSGIWWVADETPGNGDALVYADLMPVE